LDVARLRRGEQIAGVSGIALLLIMFIFDWFDYGGVGANAWDTMEWIRWLLLLTALAGIALAVMSLTQSEVNLPVATSAIATGLGVLAVLFVIIRIISPPDFGLGEVAEAFGTEADVGRAIGVFLGLIASIGVAAGGWMTMQEEGASFADQADRMRDRGTGPSDPPPPAAPPPSGPAV
jgi:hypothetical protein